MFSKLGGRGGGAGRGGGKRSLPPPPPSSGLHRPAAAGGRLPMGASAAARNRPGAAVQATAPPSREENFSLVRGDPEFAAIIRLTPDIVEEIKRVEAQGGSARIKFDPNINNISVIDVGGKEFRFTWSREPGDLCDIYEERRSGEDGHGLLVESGSAWRKLNVQRILDESTKNHVKMRSVEAERLLKSRKAIVLDPVNPSAKHQVKSMAAAGVEGRRMNWKQKKEPLLKKRKVEPSQVTHTGPPKAAFKPGSSSIIAKNRFSASPPASPLEQQGPDTSVSPFGAGTSNPEDNSHNTASRNLNKENIGSLEKEMPSNVVHGVTHEAIGRQWSTGDQPMDLRSILITLLAEKPGGMTKKALEKAVGEAIPNSAKKIESVLKNIATIQAPGRYFLKPEVEMESSKRRVSESGSSPESAHEHASAAESIFVEKATRGNNEQQAQLSSKVKGDLDPFEKIEANQNVQDPYSSDKKVYNDTEGKACSSSGSGSDSDSESDSSDSGSESGSQSRSRSKSRSPAGSGSASSSDSESDGSSSNKEGSDVEVEIMTSDDEKEEGEHKNEASELKLQASLRAASDDEHETLDRTGDNQEGQAASPPLDLNDLEMGVDMKNTLELHKQPEIPISNRTKAPETLTSAISKGEIDQYVMNSRLSNERMSSPDIHKQSENEGTPQDKKENGTSKRVVNQAISGQTPVKSNSINQQTGDAISKGEIDQYVMNSRLSNERMSSPDIHKQSKNEGTPQDKKENGTSKRVVNQGISGQTPVKSNSINQQTGDPERYSKSKFKRISDSEHFQESAKRPKSVNSAQVMSSLKNKGGSILENTFSGSSDRTRQEPYKDHSVRALNKVESDVNTDKNLQECIMPEHGRPELCKHLHKMQQSPENSYGLDSEHSGPRVNDPFGRRKKLDGHTAKHSEGLSFRVDETDTSAVKGVPVQETLSALKDKRQKDTRDETGGTSEKCPVKNVRESYAADKISTIPELYSRKSAEGYSNLKDNRHPASIGKTETEKTSVNGKGIVLRRELSDLELGEFREPPGEDSNRFERNSSFKSVEKDTATETANVNISKGRIAKKQSPVSTGVHGNQDGFKRRVAVDDFMDSTQTQQRKISLQNQQLLRVDRTDTEPPSLLDKSAENSGRRDTRTALETHAGVNKKVLGSNLPQHDNRREGQDGNHVGKESKPQKPSTIRDSANQNRNGLSMENHTNGRKVKGSSSDEDNSFYSKYDKDEPELKGPIKDYAQYKEYVKEYREKYDHYCTLNKKLEDTSDKFRKFGNDLEIAKGRDMEEYDRMVKKLREMYHECGERHKQMKKVFVLLHEEVKNLKQRIKDFAEAYENE